MKIKVLVLGLSDNYGGIEAFVYNMYKNIDRNKIVFDFIDTSPENKEIPFKEEYEKMGSKVYKIHKRHENWKKSNEELIKILKNNDYDFIHMNVMNYGWWDPVVIASKYTKSKIIIHSHSSKIDRKDFIENIILDLYGRFRIANINVYRLACGEKAGKYLFKNRKFEIIENGVEIDKYKFKENSRKEIRKEFNIDDNTVVYGHVGNFYIAKNYPKLIGIFQNILKINLNSKLILVGNDKNDPRIRKLVKKKKMENDIIFTGMRHDTNKIYSAMDFFLLPSFYEGVSISMIEAQISGLKCFASNTIDHMTDISKNVEFIDICENSYSLANKITQFNRNYERTNIIIDKKYDVKNAAKKLEQFYEKTKGEKY